ncbi:DUF4282 domain-containing protein [Dokdonella sp.]|uniref:DUF4282 domain-containing protein n=1 Tax=Dokdonella sp. TaxID=2291710 RepID=UPI002620D001|nr:DUF4282 domain-containing protein [Dokdonella sp.]
MARRRDDSAQQPVGGLLTAFSPFGSGIKGVLVSLLGMVIGVLFWRVWCELMIVVFNIYDVLKDIRNRGSGLS